MVDVNLVIYISVGVLGALIALIIGALIGLYVWVNSLSRLLKKQDDDDPYKNYLKKYPSIPRMNPVPGEELSKRYVMSTGNTDYDSLPSQKFSRNPLTSRSMMERRMSPSVIGELNNRISREQGPASKSNGYYSGDNLDSFSKPGKQDVVYYGGGAVKDRPNMAY